MSSELDLDAANERAWDIALSETEEARKIANEVLEASRKRAQIKAEALALRTLGYCELLISGFEDALRYSVEAAEKLKALGDKASEATALNTLGVTYGLLGDYEKSLEYGFEALRLNQEVGERRGEAWAFVEIGNVHLGVGDLAQARENFEKGLTIFEELEHGPGIGRAENFLGTMCERSQNLSDALAHYERSLEIGRESALAISIAGNSMCIGRVQHALGNVDAARRYFREAVESSDAVTALDLKADVRLHLGKLELEEGHLDEARARLEEGLRLIESSTLPHKAGRLHEALSSLQENEGHLEAALHHYKEFHRAQDRTFDEEGRARLKNIEIRLGVEKAEKAAEIERLRFVELAGMQAQLVQSEKMALLGRLVAGLSHEINTPIGVINSNAALAQRAVEIMKQEGLDVEGRDRLRTAVETLESAHQMTARAGERIAGLVKNLKAFARLDEAELQRVDVSRCVEESLQLFATQLPESVILEKNVKPLPEMTCRPGQLNQVFMTVLVNARDAIQEKGRIDVASFREGDHAVITISDTGRGMTPARIASLFDIDFERKDAHMRLRMGLSNAKSIVERHGGEIHVDSTLGEGTTLRIQLPLETRMVPHFGGGVPWSR